MNQLESKLAKVHTHMGIIGAALVYHAATPVVNIVRKGKSSAITARLGTPYWCDYGGVLWDGRAIAGEAKELQGATCNLPNSRVSKVQQESLLWTARAGGVAWLYVRRLRLASEKPPSTKRLITLVRQGILSPKVALILATEKNPDLEMLEDYLKMKRKDQGGAKIKRREMICDYLVPITDVTFAGGSIKLKAKWERPLKMHMHDAAQNWDRYIDEGWEGVTPWKK